MILKHRDKELLRFEWVGDTRVRIASVNDAERRFLPLEFGKGLSLNDVYWVVADDFNGTWAEFNLYDNPFSEAMAEIAFTGHGRFHAAQVAESLGFKHVKYDLVKHQGRLCSRCKLFTSDRYGYLPALKLPDRDAVLDDSRFLEMFLFDAVIFNVDRHLGNFGYLIDNDTNEIVDVAPIFDNGYGLMPHLEISARSAENNYYAIRNYLRDKRPALFSYWLGFPYELQESVLNRLAVLKKFKFKKHRHYDWPDERRTVLTGFLQKRGMVFRRLMKSGATRIW